MADTSTKDILKTLKVSFEQSNYKNGINTLLDKKNELPQDVFHFYLGNLYLKQGDLGAGRYNLQKAKKLGYQHQIVENNIKYVEAKVSEYGSFRSKEISAKIVSAALDMPVHFDLLLTCMFVFMVLLARKLKVYTSRSALGILMFLALLPLGFKEIALSGLKEGVVLKEAKIFDGPSKIFSDIRTLPAGVKVLLNAENEGWLFIEYPRHLNGWINADEVGVY